MSQLGDDVHSAGADGLPLQTRGRPVIKQGRVDGKNSEYRSGSHRIHKKLLNEIHRVLQENRDKAAHKDKKVGNVTQERRMQTVLGFFSDLMFLRYRIESVHSLSQKHLVAVFNFLEEQGQSPSTIQNKISVMRVFCEWIGKPGMVMGSDKYVKDRASVRRSTVAQEDKSWVGQGLDPLKVLSDIRALGEETVAVWLEQCWAYGLRIQESVLMRPGVGNEGDALYVREGTKGGRSRFVPIENDVQRAVLEKAQAIADKKTGQLGGRGKSAEQKIQHFYYVIRDKLGITLADEGVTTHGLRHQYMHQSYKSLTGQEPPIRGGDASKVDPDELHLAKQKLMERAGHTRESVGTAYYGSEAEAERKKTPT
ncbi:MAG: integrase domain-containing protein [Gallionella sp.]|nr:integrase domain-containing protein [Gallionella sp.]